MYPHAFGCSIGTRGFRASGPLKENHWNKNIGFGRPPENDRKLAENREMPPKPFFWAIFRFFGLIFPIFWGRPRSVFFPHFVPISGRRPEILVLAGKQGRKCSKQEALTTSELVRGPLQSLPILRNSAQEDLAVSTQLG